MLILKRKKGERLIVDGGRIVIEVTQLAQGFVKLGFTAPPEVTVHREEIWNAIQQDQVRNGRLGP